MLNPQNLLILELDVYAFWPSSLIPSPPQPLATANLFCLYEFGCLDAI